MRDPTADELVTALRILEKGYSFFIDVEDEHNNPLKYPNLSVNLSDVWIDGGSDSEEIEWDHVNLMYERMSKISFYRYLYMDVAYAAVIRNSDPPTHWLEYRRRLENDKNQLGKDLLEI